MHLSPKEHLGKKGQSLVGCTKPHSSSVYLQFGQWRHLMRFLSPMSNGSTTGLESSSGSSGTSAWSLILFLWVLRSMIVLSPWSLIGLRGCWVLSSFLLLALGPVTPSCWSCAGSLFVGRFFVSLSKTSFFSYFPSSFWFFLSNLITFGPSLSFAACLPRGRLPVAFAASLVALIAIFPLPADF